MLPCLSPERCIVCCHELLDGNQYDISDNWEFIKVKVGLYNHFINPTRNREHKRKADNPNWVDSYEQGLKVYELHFDMLNEQIKYNLGDKSWPDRMYRRHKSGVNVGNKGHSTNWASLRKRILCDAVKFLRQQ